MRRLAAAAVAAVLALALVQGSAWSWRAEPGEDGLVRLSWRAVGRRVEACRTPSAEELAALPPHMRREKICEARLAPFRLVARIDGASVFDGRILPAGARGDRPAYVHEEFRVAPGEHRLEVRFGEDAPGAEPPAPVETLTQVVHVGARRIVLVTRGDQGLALAEPTHDE